MIKWTLTATTAEISMTLITSLTVVLKDEKGPGNDAQAKITAPLGVDDQVKTEDCHLILNTSSFPKNEVTKIEGG